MPSLTRGGFVGAVVAAFAVGLCGVLFVECGQQSFAELTALIDDIQLVTIGCMTEHQLTATELGELRAPNAPDDGSSSVRSALFPSRNQQCFTRCVLLRSGLIGDPGGLHADRLIEVSVLHGKTERDSRRRLRECAPLFVSALSCAQAWDLYVCLTQ